MLLLPPLRQGRRSCLRACLEKLTESLPLVGCLRNARPCYIATPRPNTCGFAYDTSQQSLSHDQPSGARMHRDTARPKTRDGGAACSLGRAAPRVAAAAGCLYDCARGGDAAGQGRRDARSLRGVLFADAVRPTERASPLRPRLASSLANFFHNPSYQILIKPAKATVRVR